MNHVTTDLVITESKATGLGKTLDFVYQNENDNSIAHFGQWYNTYEIHWSASPVATQQHQLTLLNSGGKNYHSSRVITDGTNFSGYYVYGNPGMI